MFNRFTATARSVAVLAQEEARLQGASEITSDHILLGVIRAGGAAAEVLAELDVDVHDVRAAGERVLAARLAGLGVSLEHLRDANDLGSVASPNSVRFALEAKRVLEQALREALERRDHRIGDEHVLLAVLRDERSTGARVVAELGLSADALRLRLGHALDRAAAAS